MQKVWTNERFETDVAKAHTLDASWYLDPQLFELEKERIFARTWQAVARTDELANKGDYMAVDVAGEPLVLTRDQHGSLRAYYNVCPHRAGALARGRGNRQSLQCLYHGWTFGLDGKLIRVPGMEGTQNFDPAQFCLHEVRVDTWANYIFVNLDPDAPSLMATWGDEFNRTTGIDLIQWKLIERAEYLINCNWKVYMDNYAEGYHVPISHPGLSREMNLDDYYVDTWRYHSTQRVVIKHGGNTTKRRYADQAGNSLIRYHAIFPNFMVDDYPDNLSINILKPISVDKSLLVFEWYFPKNADAEMIDGMIKFADEVQYEDIEICEYVQKNLTSRAYNRGRFSARHENGVHHFQQLVAAHIQHDPAAQRLRLAGD